MFGYSMFNFMEIFFPIFFLLILGLILFSIFRGAAEWNKNNHSPKLTVEASVVTKRQNVSHNMSNTGNDMHMSSSSTSYYVTFQVASGDRIEFHVNGQEYGMLAEGDQGNLTFQGTRYLSFSRY